MLAIPAFTASAYNRNNVQAKNNSFSRYGNLAPLAKDTVSFGSGKKDMDDVTDGINLNTAKLIYKDAELTQRYLNNQLDKILGDLVRPPHGEGSKSKPILEIRKNTKLPESIVEKSATRKLRNVEEVKKGMTDIVRARIVLADTSKQAVDSVIDRFTEAVQNDRLKVVEIENYRPEPEINNFGDVVRTYDYASPLALKNLKAACDEKSDSSIKKVDEDRPSGYMGIHLLVKLPNGFTGEIQIIGPEVEKLKDVEDFSFKVKNGKHLDKKFASVEKMLKPLADKEDTILQKEHNIYTRNAFLHQRDIEQGFIKRKKNDKPFLTAPDYMSDDLDFNNIAAEIQKCR